MKRDDLILSMKPIVDNIVKRYTNEKPNEDLSSVGMIAVIRCVDRCIKEDIKEYEIIKAKCIVWAKNSILNTICKKDYKMTSDNNLLDNVGESNLFFTLVDIKSALTPRQNEVLNLLLNGDSYYEVMKKLNISYPMCITHIKNIKHKIIEKE